MNEPVLSFEEGEAIGTVTAVDTSRVVITVTDPSYATQIGIGNLVAIRGMTQMEYLIGIVERVTRTMRDGVMLGESDEGDASSQNEDLIRVVLIGTYRTVDGDLRNVFKRGA